MKSGSRQEHGGEIVAREFIEPRSDSPKVLQLTEEALDEIALSIELVRDRALDAAADGGGNVCLSTGGSDRSVHVVGVIRSVGNDVSAGSDPRQQCGHGAPVENLAGSQRQPDRQATAVDERVDLRAQSATRATDGVIRAPLFPPAAC